MDLFIEDKPQSLSPGFEMQPTSVLSAWGGSWQKRKKEWISLGIQSEVGREGVKLYNTTWKKPDGKKTHQPKLLISIFDPVLCELMYKWFCPEGGQVVDPFAGGSVRGIVAGKLGFSYFGVDLCKKQLEANELQRQDIVPRADVKWVCGDSKELIPFAPEADFIFTCPPYGDLERYSDDPVDLSTMTYSQFIETYRTIIEGCVNRLKPGCFACYVIGDFRDKKTGFYRGFVADTVNAFRQAGMYLYNDVILLNRIGSLPLRIGHQFDKSRKLGKTHQNVLIFRKPGTMPKFKPM